ncbi:hypothetical protein CAPTEDRAFT_147173, partial [Capitella teleta]
PQANGEAERFMNNLGKVIRTTLTEGKSWHQNLHVFLRNYRATPHSTLKQPPASLLFGQNIRTKFPELHLPSSNDSLRLVDAQQKGKMKKHVKTRTPECVT